VKYCWVHSPSAPQGRRSVCADAGVLGVQEPGTGTAGGGSPAGAGAGAGGAGGARAEGLLRTTSGEGSQGRGCHGETPSPRAARRAAAPLLRLGSRSRPRRRGSRRSWVRVPVLYCTVLYSTALYSFMYCTAVYGGGSRSCWVPLCVCLCLHRLYRPCVLLPLSLLLFFFFFFFFFLLLFFFFFSFLGRRCCPSGELPVLASAAEEVRKVDALLKHRHQTVGTGTGTRTTSPGTGSGTGAYSGVGGCSGWRRGLV